MVKLMKSVKEVSLKLYYHKSKVDKEAGVYIGGVAEPRYLKELVFNINDDYDFNLETEEFTKNGMFAVEISGSNRALKELGKFLINISMFKTQDKDYHEHIDQIQDSDGNPLVNLTVRKTS